MRSTDYFMESSRASSCTTPHHIGLSITVIVIKSTEFHWCVHDWPVPIGFIDWSIHPNDQHYNEMSLLMIWLAMIIVSASYPMSYHSPSCLFSFEDTRTHSHTCISSILHFSHFYRFVFHIIIIFSHLFLLLFPFLSRKLLWSVCVCVCALHTYI